jgi:large subunit ribosomal protein L22
MNNYSITPDKDKTAIASLRDVSISTKFSIEICRQIRHKKIQRAKNILQDILNKTAPLPLLKHHKKTAHRRGPYAAGRFPEKATKLILDLVISAEQNAKQKNLDVEKLFIVHTNAHQASRPMRAGRHRGRVMKRTHVEMVLQEK